MSFTFAIVKKDEGRVICPLNEETGDPYLAHSFDAQSFFDQFQEGVTIEISEPGHVLKNDLAEAKRLLSSVKDKLRNPGRFDFVADEIERFLQK